MKLYGLLGKTLSHSFSKKYFTEKFAALGLSDHVFELFEIPFIEDFPQLLDSKSPISGMNVTIPYKEAVMPYLNGLDISAQNVGAVNVIKFMSDGSLVGYNSDYYGFKQSLLNTLKTYAMPIPSQALILGTGGAAKAVMAALADIGTSYAIVSRDKSKGHYDYSELSEELIKSHTLIVNSSPVGTYPNVNDAPNIPYHFLGSNHLLFDLVYNPETTAFVQKGAEYGAKSKNGLEMLHLQAEKAWEIWNA